MSVAFKPWLCRKGRYLARLLAEPRSLLIFTADLYNKFFHGIDPVTEDAIYNPDLLTEETEQLKISNLGLTSYRDLDGI